MHVLFFLPLPKQLIEHTIKVCRSRNAVLVGASGIVMQETENMFKVVSWQDKL